MTVFSRNTQTHNHHKLQPGVTPQVKSVLLNLRSTVNVATMRLQGPHAIYRGLFLWIPPSLHLSFFPTCWPFLPMCSYSFSTSEQSNDKHIQSTAMWSQGHLVFCFSPLALSPASSPWFFFPRGSKWGQIFSFLLCNLIKAMTLVAAFRAGGDSQQRTPTYRACPLFHSYSLCLQYVWCCAYMCHECARECHTNIIKNDFKQHASVWCRPYRSLTL